MYTESVQDTFLCVFRYGESVGVLRIEIHFRKDTTPTKILEFATSDLEMAQRALETWGSLWYVVLVVDTFYKSGADTFFVCGGTVR